VFDTRNMGRRVETLGVRSMRPILAVLALLLLPYAPARAQGAPAVADHPLADVFHRYGDSGVGWTGGDSTYSVPLPDGRVVWMFSDTFLGQVEPNHGRSNFTPMIHNSFVVQDGEALTTLHGDNNGRPMSLIPTEGNDRLGSYWVADGTVEGDRLHVFVNRFAILGVTFQQVANDVATFTLPDLRLEKISPSPGAYIPCLQCGSPINWGIGILETEAYTYVYGSDEPPLAKHLHVARVPSGRLLEGPWEYWTGRGWTTDALASARILDRVSGEVSVVRTRTGYRLVAQDTGILPEIYAYTAPDPWGPWTNKTLLFRTTDFPHDPVNGSRITYNAHEHPHLATETSTVVTYNMNSTSSAELYGDVHVYRPRFKVVPHPPGGPPL